MRRTIFTEEHELFRETARTFYLRECARTPSSGSATDR